MLCASFWITSIKLVNEAEAELLKKIKKTKHWTKEQKLKQNTS